MADTRDQNIRRLDGTLLLVFRELMRQGRATAAAERLGLSQSGVSHALARLREVFGDPLFLRRPHGLEPTRRARELAPQVEALIALAQDAVGGAAGFDPAGATRRFQVGAAEFVTALIAAPVLRSLEQDAPTASLAFRFLVGDAALAALRRGDIDLAVGRFREVSEPLVREPLFRDRYAVVARLGHPALTEGLGRAAFARLGHVAVSPEGEAGGGDPTLSRILARQRVVAIAPRFLTAFAMAAATDALVTAPRPLALRYAAAFGLDVFETPFAPPPLEVFTVRRAGPQADPAAAWLEQKVRTAV